METVITSKKKPTPRQKKAAKEVVKNLLRDKPLSTGQVLENIGYSKGIAQTPSMVLETVGFKEALSSIGLKEALEAEGINPKKIAEKINVLLEATTEEGDDYNAIDKGLKHATAIYGIIDPSKPSENKTTYNFIFSAPVQAKVREMEHEIKALLTKPHATEN